MRLSIKILISLVLFGVPLFSTRAQSDSLTRRFEYYNSFVSGVLIGSSSSDSEKEYSVSLSTIHGIKLRSGIKFGFGIGLDTYKNVNAFPVFVSFTYDQDRKKQGIFIQLNSGYSFVRYTAADKESFGDLYEKGGFTINPMIGYRIKFEKIRIYWQVGYKYQRAVVGYTYPDWWGGPLLFSKQYEFNKFIFQLGFGFH